MGERRLPEGYDWDKHFSPSYKPWDQRVCLAPNGDLFKAIRKGKADVVTDTIERFTETGIMLGVGRGARCRHHRHGNGFERTAVRRRSVSDQNGQTVMLPDPDDLQGHDVHRPAQHRLHHRLHQCRRGHSRPTWSRSSSAAVINYMDANGFDTVEPQHPGDTVDERPLMEFTPGYVLRALDQLPKVGARSPWRLKQNYLFDMRMIRNGKVDDESLLFTKHHAPVGASV